jgi:hypothetical protein
VSFVTNFIGRREYVGVTVKDLMAAPYSRIVAMQLTLLFGGWVLLALKSPLPALALLMGMKTVVDFRAHQQEHRELAARLSADKRDHRVMLKSGDLSA